MGKYKLEISNAVTGEKFSPVVFEEIIQEEAKAKSYKFLLDAADSFVDGEYIGKLFRRVPILPIWQEVTAPVISCVVSAGNAILTVERVRYSRENKLIRSLHDICLKLDQLKQQFALALLSSVPLLPTDVHTALYQSKTILETLFAYYRPEYLDISQLTDMKEKISVASEKIETSYKAYANLSFFQDYITTVTAEVSSIQVMLLLFLKSNNL